MSQGETLSRKDKKAQRDADRQKKGKKRKHEEVEEPAEQNELLKDFIPLDATGDGPTAADDEPVDPKIVSRRRKKRKTGDAQSNAVVVKQQDLDNASTTPATKPKKRKKVNTEQVENAENAQQVPASDAAKPRFILFIGNLPYSATDTTIQAHFKSLQPFTLRHRTDPKTKKSKGFAFLEFENYDRMKTCLKLYHHSVFDPAKAAADATADGKTAPKDSEKKPKAARRINVELTAGGGGKTEGRMEKIKAKNVRLDEQRKRRAEEEAKEKAKKEKKVEKANVVGPKEKKPKAEATGGGQGDASIHPSRLARIQT